MTDNVQVTFAGAPAKVAAAIHAMHGAPIATPTTVEHEVTGAVIKANPEKRYVLGVAYQAGKSDLIAKGLDEHRDFMTADELELSAWRFVAKGSRVGLLHSGYRAGNDDLDADDGTEGHALVVESYIYRGPDWVLKDAAGDDVVVKAGDWLVGAVLDETAWDLWKRGRITGWSPQGVAVRRTRKPGTAAVAKASDTAQLAITISGPQDQIAAFTRLAAVIEQLSSIGASRTVSIDVDGDGAAALRFDLGGIDVPPLADAELDDDVIRLPGIGD